MTTLDDNPIKQALLKAIRKGNAQKLKDILKANPTVSANETLDSAENRLLHKAARYVYVYIHMLLLLFSLLHDCSFCSFDLSCFLLNLV